jgi:hypothetical protein
MAGASAVSALGDAIRNEANGSARRQSLLRLADKVDELSQLSENLAGQFDRALNKIAVLEDRFDQARHLAAIERVRVLADMWASEVSSDEQDYITAAKYRAVARDIYEALDGTP